MRRLHESKIVVVIWYWTTFVFLIVLAGVETLPHELFKSARIDGATEPQIIRRIFLPLLKPIVLVAVVTPTIFAFKVYEQIYLLTDGGPENRTEVVTSYVVRVFFNQNRMGHGIANFAQDFQVLYGNIAVAASFVAMPGFLMVLFARRYVARGLSSARLRVEPGRLEHASKRVAVAGPVVARRSLFDGLGATRRSSLSNRASLRIYCGQSFTARSEKLLTPNSPEASLADSERK